MRQVALAVAMMLAGLPAWALDASGADILGLRLGMSESDVTTQLAQQGFSPIIVPGECGEADACPVTVRAATRDGALLITLSAKTGMQQVEYKFRGHGSGEPQKIEAAIADRFGQPDQQTPMAWCRAVGSDGMCPREQPSLTFQSDTLTVILKAGSHSSEHEQQSR